MKKKLAYECSSEYQKYRDHMLALHSQEHGHVNEAQYDSLYVGNPYGEALLCLCFDGDKLVGQENYIRQDVAWQGKVHRGALGINTLVDARYRLFYGVFKRLCEITLEEMEKRSDILCAFANEESKQYYLKYFGWEIASKVQVYKKAIGYSGPGVESLLAMFRRGRLENEFSIEEVERFEATELDRLIQQHAEASGYAYIYKSAEFLNWRYLESKHYKVRGFVLLDGEKVCGYCITWRSGTEEKIVDFLVEGDKVSVFDKMISTLSATSRKDGAKRLVVYATPGCWYEGALKKRVFIKRWEFDFLTRRFSEGGPKGPWNIQVGDFDIF